jgi:hypothetical protein
MDFLEVIDGHPDVDPGGFEGIMAQHLLQASDWGKLGTFFNSQIS